MGNGADLVESRIEQGGSYQDSSGNGHNLTALGDTGRANQKDISISAGSVYKGLILGTDGTDGRAPSYLENSDAANAATVNVDGTFTFDATGLAVNDYRFSVDISDGVTTYTDTIEITVV